MKDNEEIKKGRGAGRRGRKIRNWMGQNKADSGIKERGRKEKRERGGKRVKIKAGKKKENRTRYWETHQQ